MTNHKINHPHFKKGRILKIEMLEDFRDYPRDVLDVYNADMSDGIVCGFAPTVDKSIITFSKGIVKHDGKLYVFHDPTIIDYGATETDVVAKLIFLDEVDGKDYLTRHVDVVLEERLDQGKPDQGKAIRDNQIELGRFKLKTGAYLRSDYQDLNDFTTEYNTINIVNVLYAGFKQPTLSHLILKYFAREVLAVRPGVASSGAIKPESTLDINFCMMCLNSGRIDREVILTYISFKTGKDIKALADLSNVDIHAMLVSILDNIKRENPGHGQRLPVRKKVIMD